MPVSMTDLRFKSRMADQQIAKSLSEAQRSRMTTAFLCHAHKDRSLVQLAVPRLADGNEPASTPLSTQRLDI